MMLKRYTNFPVYAITYLMYGDASGITEEDVENIENWIDSEGIRHLNLVSVDSDVYFKHKPRFGLACDCVDVTFM